MKISKDIRALSDAFNFDASNAAAKKVVGYDVSVADSFEKLNPVLTNGHRVNPITTIFDNSIPNEVRSVLMQFVQKIPQDKSPQTMSDDELIAMLPSRYMQSLPQLDAVRDALILLASERGIGEPASSEPASSEPAASESASSVSSSNE